MEIVAVRHGETKLNKEGIIIGHLPTPLSETGRESVKQLAARLPKKFDIILTSDLPRARETATIISEALGVPLAFHQELREIDYGTDAGKPKAKVRAKESRYHTDPSYQHPGGESFEQLAERIIPFLINLESQYEKVLLVTHAGCLRVLAAFCSGESLSQWLTRKMPHDAIIRCTLTGGEVMNFAL